MHTAKDRLLLIDGQPAFREGLAAELRRHLHDLHVQEVCAIDDALAALAGPGRLCLIVYDWHLAKAGGRTGLNALLGNGVACPVFITCDCEQDVASLMPLGPRVAGVACKCIGPSELGRQILVGLDRQDAKAANQFTLREREVLARLREGKTNKQIASELGIHAATVRDHVSAILHVLGASNRTEAAIKAWTLDSSNGPQLP